MSFDDKLHLTTPQEVVGVHELLRDSEIEAREGWGGSDQPVPVVVLSSVEAMKILEQDWPSSVYHLKIQMYA